MNRTFSLPFLIITVGFCVCLILSNLIEIKTIDIGPLTIAAGIILFPVSYILNDCIVEIYGFRKARLVVWLGFSMSFFVAIILHIAIAIPGSKSWTGQQAMELIYGSVPRIILASFIAFFCGSMINAYVMSRMKLISAGKNFSVRAIVSTLWGEGADSLIFFPIAFAGVLPMGTIITLIVSQTVLKTAYEIVILPVTIRFVRWLKKFEGSDVYDKDISYKWWKITEI